MSEQPKMSPASDADRPPAVITAAGPAAVLAWEDFLGGEGLAASTRNLYWQQAAQFLRWLDVQGHGVAQVTPALVASYLDGRCASPHARLAYRTPLRRLFGCLAARQVISRDPTRPDTHSETKEAPAAGPGDRPTLADLRAFLLDLDGIREGSRSYRPGLVAMYPVVVGGMDARAIASFTGIPVEEVETYAARLRENGVWTEDGKVLLDSPDPDMAELVVNLVLIVGCAGGVFKRFPPEDEPEQGGPGPNPARLAAPGGGEP